MAANGMRNGHSTIDSLGPKTEAQRCELAVTGHFQEFTKLSDAHVK